MRGEQSFIVFVVRDDARLGAALSIERDDVCRLQQLGRQVAVRLQQRQRAGAESVVRSPYATNPYGVRLDGAGDFLRRWEYNAVRFLEREGYDVTYTTDVDTHERPIAAGAPPLPPRLPLDRPRRVLVVADARARRVGARPRRPPRVSRRRRLLLADPVRAQRPRQRGPHIVGYKEAAGNLDPLALDGRPQNDRLITGRWRDRPVSRPEERLVGVMYAADPVDADIIVERGGSLGVRRAGLRNGDALRGLLGYEVDAMYGGGPPAIERLAHSPFVDQGAQGKVRYADMTIYTADSGALVFATGSMQWSWGLDGYNAPAWHTRRARARRRSGSRATSSTACCGRRRRRGRRRHGSRARSS